MQLHLKTDQIEELQEKITAARSSGTISLPNARPQIMQGVDKDGDILLHIVFIVDERYPLSYDSRMALADLIMNYMNERDMPHIPIIHQIGETEWPAISKGFKSAISAFA